MPDRVASEYLLDGIGRGKPMFNLAIFRVEAEAGLLARVRQARQISGLIFPSLATGSGRACGSARPVLFGTAGYPPGGAVGFCLVQVSAL